MRTTLLPLGSRFHLPNSHKHPSQMTSSDSGEKTSTQPARDKEVIILSDSEDSSIFTGVQSRAVLHKNRSTEPRISATSESEEQSNYFKKRANFAPVEEMQERIVDISGSRKHNQTESSLEITFKTDQFHNRSIFYDFQDLRIVSPEEYTARVKHQNSIRIMRDRFLLDNRKRSAREGRRLCFKFNFEAPFNELRLIRLMDDWHLSLHSSATDIDVIREIDRSDFKDGESAYKAASELLGAASGDHFYLVCRYQMTQSGVKRDQGFTTSAALMKMAPDKMINYCESTMMGAMQQGVVDMNEMDLL